MTQKSGSLEKPQANKKKGLEDRLSEVLVEFLMECCKSQELKEVSVTLITSSKNVHLKMTSESTIGIKDEKTQQTTYFDDIVKLRNW